MSHSVGVSLKEVNVNDNIGSVPHFRAILRRTIFGIVRAVEQRVAAELEEEEEEEDEKKLLEAAEAMAEGAGCDVPLSFSSKTAKRRKRKRRKQQRKTNAPIKKVPSLIDFESFSSEMCIEQNLFNYKEAPGSEERVVKVLGVGRASPTGSTVIVRYMNCYDIAQQSKSDRNNNSSGRDEKSNGINRTSNGNGKCIGEVVAATIDTKIDEQMLEVGSSSEVNGCSVKDIGSSSSISWEAPAFDRQFEVPRSLLHPLRQSQRERIHEIVQQDETAVLRRGCPPKVHCKYWNQRFRLLSRFDDGVLLDDESWFSITPEAAAQYVTKRCLNLALQRKSPIRSVLDGFCGCGGNTIPFAVHAVYGTMAIQAPSLTVTAVDRDILKLQYLRYDHFLIS